MFVCGDHVLVREGKPGVEARELNGRDRSVAVRVVGEFHSADHGRCVDRGRAP